MAKNRYRPRAVQTEGGIAYELLAVALLQQPDFQQLLTQLSQQLREQITQQLIKQPLQQFGTALGQEIQAGLLGDGATRFGLSETQIGGLLQDMLTQAERLR